MNSFETAARYACLAAAAIMLIAVVSFRAGRGRGRVEGIRLGGAEAMIVARQRALESGFCPVCRGECGKPNDAAPAADSAGPSLTSACRTYPLTGGRGRGPRSEGGAIL